MGEPEGFKWWSIRKGSAVLRLETVGGSYLQPADKFEFLAGQLFHVRADLDRNLEVRPRAANGATGVHARELAAGTMGQLRSLRIEDRRLADSIVEAARRCGQARGPWMLTLHLGEDWGFIVRPEAGSGPFVLRVASK